MVENVENIENIEEKIEKSPTRWTWLTTTLKVLVSFGLVIFLLYQAGFSETIARLKTASPVSLIGALMVYFLGVFIRAYRWQGLLSKLGVKVSLGRLSWLYLIGFFFNQLVPTGIGGDAMRTYMLAKDGVGGSVAANSVIVDRAAGLYSLLVMGCLVLCFQPSLVSSKIALVLVGMTVGATIGIIFLAWSSNRLNFEKLPFVGKKFSKAFSKFYASFADYSLTSLLKSLAVSIFFNLLLIVTNIFLAEALGLNISASYFFLFIPIISATLVLPFSINGTGTREWAYVFLFGQIGVEESAALAMSLSFYGLNLFLALVGGACFLVQSLQRSREVL
ncbi:MAG: flippase-like domain-containing protein [Blastocatellia bacterium]|nr:flippase-like domain-containing protein [Blastocatellia bacterium]